MALLGPTWLPAAILLFGLGLSVSQQLWLKPLGLVETRWVVAGLFTACFLSLLAVSAWLAAFLLLSALSLPVSIAALRAGWLKEIVLPTYGIITLLQLSAWVVILSLLAKHLAGYLVLSLAGMVACAVYTNLIAFLQVHCNLGISYRIAYGPIGEIMNEPVGCLHSVWRPAAMNAMLLPVTLGVGIHSGNIWWYLAALFAAATMIWQLAASKTTTAIASAFAGMFAAGLAMKAYLLFAIASPLALVAYPSIRSGMKGDPRWEIWRELWNRVKQDHFLGRGIGAWSGAGVRGSVETERVWLWAHSDWMEALYDTGPLPPLVALAFMGEATWRAWSGLPALQAGIYGGLVSLSVVALGYMPFRTWPVCLIGIGLIAAWLA